MKIALVKPPNNGSQSRGGGYYTNHLWSELEKIDDISLVGFSLNPLAYRAFDLVHFSFFDEFFFTLPPFLPGKFIVSILDCTKLRFPQHFPVGLRAKFAWPLQRFLVRRSGAIITISEASKSDISTWFSYDPEKIFVTHLAPDTNLKPIKDTSILQRIKVNYHLPEKFVLYVGGVNWNKNLPTLVKACKKAQTNLVLVGKEFTAGNPDLSHPEMQPFKEVLALSKDDKRIQMLGFVSTQDLVGIYNLANVYVQPSVYEGFGLPVLEAMACGTAVICGRNASLPEIAGSAATYANVEDVNDLADKISHVRKTGKEITQAAKFSWRTTAQKTYEIYQKVLAEN